MAGDALDGDVRRLRHGGRGGGNGDPLGYRPVRSEGDGTGGGGGGGGSGGAGGGGEDRKSTRLNSSHSQISYAVFCLKKKKKQTIRTNGGGFHGLRRIQLIPGVGT